MLEKLKDKQSQNNQVNKTRHQQNSVQISTPNGKVTLESEFSKPQIVINNFMINSKQKRKKSKEQSCCIQSKKKRKNLSISNTQNEIKKFIQFRDVKKERKIELKKNYINKQKYKSKNRNFVQGFSLFKIKEKSKSKQKSVPKDVQNENSNFMNNNEMD